ncbi:MAG: DUF4396 domain-containing protein [Candidatus Saccharimonadales bacterium]
MFNDDASKMAINATVHCLTGCAIGEISGMVIGSLLGMSNLPMLALSITLAFLFGYSLTSLPLLKSGMTLRQVAPLALASDTLSIATMELADNTVLALIPGALGASVGNPLFWLSLSASLLIAFLAAVPVNKYLIARGKGHAVMHHHHEM